jgi:hypothetical protein
VFFNRAKGIRFLSPEQISAEVLSLISWESAISISAKDAADFFPTAGSIPERSCCRAWRTETLP